MVIHDTYRAGVTVFRCKWYENEIGPGYRVIGSGQRILPPAPAGEQQRRRLAHRRRDLEVIIDQDLMTGAAIARWCGRSLIRLPMIRLLVSGHYLEADRKRALVMQFKHPLDAAAFRMDFRDLVSPEEW